MKLFLFSLLCVAGLASLRAGAAEQRVAIFAGGCFWCMEPPFDALDGVLSTRVGYIGGHLKNPTYREVSAGNSGHTEALKVIYDPDRVSYQTLLATFWRTIDPTTPDRQFCDHGDQYRTAIFYVNTRQRELAEKSLRALRKNKPFPEPVVTKVTAATHFYLAEEYHQDYYLKNPLRYAYYRYRCGRDQRLDAVWKGAKNE